MSIKLLALDLDGTLLDRQSRLSDENREAVLAARRAGLEVVLVTGRSWRGTREFYEALRLTGPAICYMGALVVADGSGRIASHRPLEPGAWERLRNFAVEEGLAVTACVAPDLRVAQGELPDHDLVAADTAYATCRADDFIPWDEWNPYTEIQPDLGACTTPPVVLAVYGDRAVRRALEAFPGGLPGCQFDLTDRIAGETVLHIWHERVDKGTALAEFCREWSIRPEEVAAMGDALMDRPMIELAGIGVAMPQAPDELKAAARWVAAPAQAIWRILRGETR